MAHKSFTKQQQKELADNPYTFRVSNKQISFTKEFKEKFWELYQHGKTPRQILCVLGYDPDIFSEARITGIQCLIKKEFAKTGEFHSGRNRSEVVHTMNGVDENPTNETIMKMQHELLYMKQEIEYLKKISSIRDTRK